MKETETLAAGMFAILVLIGMAAVVFIVSTKSDEPEIGHRSHVIGELE